MFNYSGFFISHCQIDEKKTCTCKTKSSDASCFEIAEKLNKIFSSSNLKKDFPFEEAIIKCPMRGEWTSYFTMKYYYSNKYLLSENDSLDIEDHFLEITNKRIDLNYKKKGLSLIVLKRQ